MRMVVLVCSALLVLAVGFEVYASGYAPAALMELGRYDEARTLVARRLAEDPTDTRAASALIPLYEKDEKWSRLPPLYELLFERAESETDKLDLLRKLVEVTGRKLNDKKSAAGYARKAYTGGRAGTVLTSARAATIAGAAIRWRRR